MKIIPIKKLKEKSLKKIKKELGKKNLCYVLLTCSHPANDGKMFVEVCYEGDESVASYLVDSAKVVLNERINSPQNI